MSINNGQGAAKETFFIFNLLRFLFPAKQQQRPVTKAVDTSPIAV
jgi:hypothetical protein